MVSPPRSPRNRSLLRRNVVVGASTAAAVALLLSYHTSLSSGGATPSVSAAPVSSVAGAQAGAVTSSGEPSPSTGSAPATPVGGTTAAAGASTTVTGDAVDTRFGPVQVEITVQDGRIVAADAVASPDGDGRSVEINAQAVPLLNQQAVAAQSAGIDGVSGATYTSNGYMQSLQSAIDQAGLPTAAAAQ